MRVPRFAHSKTITIWEPRWKDKKILIAKHHISAQVPHYKIVFEKEGVRLPSYPDDYYLSYHTIVKSKRDTNGSAPCYAVKLAHLEDYEVEAHSYLEVF